jgi:hypothetical protein
MAGPIRRASSLGRPVGDDGPGLFEPPSRGGARPPAPPATGPRRPALGRPAPVLRAVPADPAAPPFGRETWPPPIEAGWDALLDWAGPDSPEGVDLALGLWLGRVPHPGTGPAEGPAPRR